MAGFWRNDRWVFMTILLASLPAMLIHLGDPPFIEDEGIRSLVALEMDLSGNYIAPTLNGEYYFKKPPLWNWILLLTFKLTGQVNEFTARIPTLFFLYVFCITIFLVYRKWVGSHHAMLNAIVFLTSGRILFWDSMLALIDICFSWVIFLMFVWIYAYHQKRKYTALYLGAYTLATIAFMLKALPALVFLAFTLLAVQIHGGTWRKLFSWNHLLGFGVLISTLSLYLLLYNQYYPIENLLSVFVDESTQRTVIEYGFLHSILQIFVFPFEMIYHFLPWSLFVLLFFHPHALHEIKKHPFITFAALVFVANIWIYWTSPEIYPRYLFMLSPLYFGVGIYLYECLSDHFMKRALNIGLLTLGVVVWLGSTVVLWVEPTHSMSGVWLKWLLPALPMLYFLNRMFRMPQQRIIAFTCFLIFARLGFSLIILPSRGENSKLVETRQDAQRIALEMTDQALYLYREDSMRYEASFYITNQTGEILRSKNALEAGAFYLVNPRRHPEVLQRFKPLDSLRIQRKEKYMYLIKVPTI